MQDLQKNRTILNSLPAELGITFTSFSDRLFMNCISNGKTVGSILAEYCLFEVTLFDKLFIFKQIEFNLKV